MQRKRLPRAGGLVGIAVLLGCAGRQPSATSGAEPAAASTRPLRATSDPSAAALQDAMTRTSIPPADVAGILQRYQEELLASRARLVLLQNLGEEAFYLSVSVAGDRVVLSGVLPAAARQKRAVDAVAQLHGVSSVEARFQPEPAAAARSRSAAATQQAVDDALFDVKDKLMANQIELELLQELGADALAIDVEVHRHVARLQGAVPSQGAAQRARSRAQTFQGIREVENQLWVVPHTP